MPTAIATIVSSGTIVTPAMKRGTMRYATGSYASVSSASICSVTRIVPISAVIFAPTRPASTSAVSSGPSSSTMLCRVIHPTTENCTPGKSWYVVWYAVTAPMNADTVATSGIESTPICRICAIVSGRYVPRLAERTDEVAQKEHERAELPEHR